MKKEKDEKPIVKETDKPINERGSCGVCGAPAGWPCERGCEEGWPRR